MKQSSVDVEVFQFPRSLPNDLEGFALFYPKKFPSVIPLFQKLAREYFKKPEKFKKFIYKEQKELFEGFYKIKNDYDKEKVKTNELIVRTDERLHKLFCFKFWIVNYGFCDGPLHDYYVERIRHYSEKVAEWETIEEKERAVLDFERTLLQGDYADLYLQSAFIGIELYNKFSSSKLFSGFVDKLKQELTKHDDKSCYKIIEDVLKIIKTKKNTEINEIHELLKEPIETARVRGDNLALYQVIIHAFEFHEKNLELKERYEHMVKNISHILDLGRNKLSKQEYEELKVCYQMTNLFKEAKDVFGTLDPYIIPFWFGMLEELAKRINVPKYMMNMGHAGMFYFLVWYLPAELKAKVFTPDPAPFDLKKL
ncbi:hypothetical protein HY483_01955 [Candidatus Woesearchaeota archaeon]|nr:hypothetical protein [Candidatus Woesearchaeota archaeon]